jgi:hypothetical protein
MPESVAVADFASTVGIERCSAVRANDPQILKSVVVRHPVDVIENQRHPAASPLLVLATHLAATLLVALFKEPLLELCPRVGRLCGQIRLSGVAALPGGRLAEAPESK